MVDEEAGGVMGRTALWWIATPPLMVVKNYKYLSTF